MPNELAIVSGIGAVQSMLFALLIGAKRKRKIPDWTLLLWFWVFSIHLLLGFYEKIDAVEVFITTIGFLHGPFFLLYTKAVFKQQFTKTDVLHFLPFVFFSFYSFFIEQHSELLWEIVILVAKLISVTAYPIYILYTHPQRLTALKTRKTDPSTPELSWIKTIAILFLISTGISIIRLTTELVVGVAYFELWDVLRYIILVTVIGFYGLKYGMVFRPEFPIDSTLKERKYKHSPLTEEEIPECITRINRFFQENEAYLGPEFSLTVLSESINIPKHHLSQIINSEMHTSFYDLVNAKRVTHAMQRIQEGDSLQLSLEGLGYECGFNSKSAFFHHFKKYTGKTPGQYKREIGAD